MSTGPPTGAQGERGLSPPAAPALVDARGHRCPTPTLRLRRALEALQPGDRVRLLADDPLAQIDLPHFVAAAGHLLLSLDVADGRIEALVQKVGAE